MIDTLLPDLVMPLLPFADILDGIKDSIHIVDRQWRIVYANQATLRNTQKTARELLGKYLWDVFPEALDTPIYDHYHRAMREQTGAHFELYYPALEAWYEIRAHPSSQYLTIHAVDVTERVRTEAALRDSEARFCALAEAAPGFVWASNPDGVLEYINSQWTEYTGLTFEQTAAHQMANAVHPEDLPQIYAQWKQAKETEATYMTEFRLRRASDGEYRWFLARSQPHHDETGRLLRWFGVTTDVDEQKRAQEAVADLNTRLRRAMAESHHRIKNNLQVLSALIEMQMPEPGEIVPASVLQRLGQHVRSLAALHELLTKEAKTDDDLSLVRVPAVLSKLVEMLRVASGSERCLFIRRADNAQIPVKQAGSLTLLVNELVQNAVKHGRGDIEIRFTLCEEPGKGEESGTGERETKSWARLEVCDEGPGFPVAFDAQKAANTGLELIESMARWDLGGQPHYTNRPCGGACVTVIFPLATL